MIGYYVHHHGHGHRHRATAIATACRTPVIGFSSLPRPAGWPGRWVRLPDDADGVDPGTADVTAGATLHWVPPCTQDWPPAWDGSPRNWRAARSR